ncbi:MULTISPECIES: ABC transporter substrate-binding protein [unclassified Okeania]|uniref:ABC transporter substrate-binding protein n=2 Tax=Microcoleaceae TaxID=1892252 RepID=UPI0013B9E0C0|nr:MULTISPECIES: ABC transporter substrate-binding protein [unclassified Okeania]NES78880.1 ABC transporter substrate-binding protein [Okeania sp. SIO1H4]NET22390.1 ABC transporter substrate-binding protein [Okeania sp. SIO1H5]NET95573.1 ABC transporter substrate-binding protein [Okeania sp. SIO1H2]
MEAIKIIKIKLIDSGENGFHVILNSIGANFEPIDGFLPCLPAELEKSFNQWQSAYSQLEDVRKVATRISPQSVVNYSSNEEKEQVKISLNQWLDSGESSWQPVRDELISVLSSLGNSDSEIRLFLDIQNPNLCRIPWQEWNLFQSRFPQTEIAIRVRGQGRFRRPRKSSKVRIIAIVGKSDGINTQLDLEVIQKLKEKGAEVRFLNQPTQEILSDTLREEPGYHILIFAGHSCSKEDGSIGWIYLNERDKLSIKEFKNSLRYAIDNGLQLAIFNSCDGLGLANQLAKLGLSRIIVMREPVPDLVAVKFLEYFFAEFANNQSLFKSMRIARERLEHFESEYPGAMWLPTLCIQETALSHPLSWQQLISSNLWQKVINKFKLPLGLTTGILLVILGINLVKNQFTETKVIGIQPAILQNISQGEKLLISSEKNPAKEEGIEKFYNGNFAQAIAQFRQSLQVKKNDPETLIYLNNAIAQQKSDTNIGQKIEIAVSVPISQESDISQEILRGVAQAQSEFNCGLPEISLAIKDTENQLNCSGSFNGKFLKVTIADDEYLPETAEKIAQTLVAKEEIIAVIGHSSSDMTLQAGEIYNKAELVVISPTSTSILLKNFGKFVLRVAPNDHLAAQTLWNYLERQNWADKKIAVAYIPGNIYSQSLTKEFNKLLPEKFVYKCNISSGNFSASDCVEEAQNRGAEIMFLVPATDRTLSNVIGIINNAKGLKLLGGDSIYNPRVLKDAGQQADRANLTLAIPWHRHPNSQFSQTAQKFWNAEINWRTAKSYDATKTIIKAVDEMMGNYSRKQLQRILSNPNFSLEGVTGKIRFSESGDRQFIEKDKPVLVQVKPNVKSGKYEFVILEQ